MSTILAVFLLLPVVFQEAPPDPEAAYREDFADYTEISGMTDPTEQTTAYIAFLEEGFDDRLLEFVVSGSLQGLNAMTQAGNHDAVYPLADRLAAVHPDAAATAGALALEAAATSGNAEQIIKYGEPFYEANPSPQIALLLTQAYGQDNREKMLEYGRVVLDSGEYPIPDIWAIAFEIIQADDDAGNLADAVAQARQFRSAVRSAPAGVAADNWNSIQIYLLDMIARDDFDAGRYAAALPSFDAILAIEPRNEKALYFKGNCMLQTGGSVSAALDALAMAVVLEGNYAGPARDLLTSTYARNAPGGASDRFVQEDLADARRALGL